MKPNVFITCESCFNKYDTDFAYEHYECADDYTKYKCPKCNTIISYNTVKTEAIPILDWLLRTDGALYSKIIKKYFEQFNDLP